MAKEERKLRGYDYDGNPVFISDHPAMTREEKEADLLRAIDRYGVFPNNKRYACFGEGWYFELKGKHKPDISHIVRVDHEGEIIESKPFDVMKGM